MNMLISSLKFPEWLTILIFFSLVLFIGLHLFVIWFSESKEIKKSNNPYRLLFIFLLIYFLFDRNNSQSFVLWASFISYSATFTFTFKPLCCQIICKFCILCFGNYQINLFSHFGITFDLISINKLTIGLFLKGLLMEEIGKMLQSTKIFQSNIRYIQSISSILISLLLVVYYHGHYNKYSLRFYDDIFQSITCIMYYQVYWFGFSKFMNYIFFPICQWKYQITANNSFFKYQPYIIVFVTVGSFYLIWHTMSDVLLKYYALLYFYRFCVYKIPALILSDVFLQYGRYLDTIEPAFQSMTNEAISDSLIYHGSATKDDLLIVGYSRLTINHDQLIDTRNINGVILRFYNTPKWDTLNKMDIGNHIKFFNNSRTARFNGVQRHVFREGFKLVISNEVFNSSEGKDKIFIKLRVRNVLLKGYPCTNIAILPEHFLNWFMGLANNNNYTTPMIDAEFRSLPGFWNLNWMIDNVQKSERPSSFWDVKTWKNKMLSGSNNNGDIVKIKFDFVKMKAICWKNKVKKKKTFPVQSNVNYKIIVNIPIMGDEVTLLY